MFRVEIARTPDALDEVVRLRQRVFAGEGHHLPARADRFDGLLTTANFVAVVDGRIVGAIRAVRNSPAGHPTDEFFDFQGHLGPDAVLGSTGMFCVERASRRIHGLPTALAARAWAWLVDGGATHLVAACNPRIEALATSFGAWRVGEQFIAPGSGLPTVPMVVTPARIAIAA